VAFSLEQNEFNGATYLELSLSDAKSSAPQEPQPLTTSHSEA
jgi:hypothetical protein